VLEQVRIGLFCRWPLSADRFAGTAKTLLVRTMAEVLGSGFSKRIQFTPDLMPTTSRVPTSLKKTNTAIGRGPFVRGPLFANVLLADEINRTPPKTQSGAAGSDAGKVLHRSRQSLQAARAVFVLATQNPIELEGTYPFPKLSSTVFCSTSFWTTCRRGRIAGCRLTTTTHVAKADPITGLRRRFSTSSNWFA